MFDARGERLLALTFHESGNNSVVECQLPKLKVAGSTPVARSNSHPLVKVLTIFVTDDADFCQFLDVCWFPFESLHSESRS